MNSSNLSNREQIILDAVKAASTDALRSALFGLLLILDEGMVGDQPGSSPRELAAFGVKSLELYDESFGEGKTTTVDEFEQTLIQRTSGPLDVEL